MRKIVAAGVLWLLFAPGSLAEADHCIYQGLKFGFLTYYCPPPSERLETPQGVSLGIRPRWAPRGQQRLLEERGELGEFARRTAERYNVDPRLVHTVITVESGWNPRAVSRKGARGLMQLMPETADQLGVTDLFDPYENIDGGVRHLRELLDEFRGDVRLVLAAYNAGSKAVYAHRGVPPYPETQDYVRRALELYRRAS